jgi:hypothetical protein
MIMLHCSLQDMNILLGSQKLRGRLHAELLHMNTLSFVTAASPFRNQLLHGVKFLSVVSKSLSTKYPIPKTD